MGTRGEIWMKGPNLFRGYWNKPEATAEVLVDGWLATGDLGRIDDEGFLYIEDRAKDMVLRGGENVYSAEVESAIYEHPGVYEAAVFGVPHERLGEEVATVITRRPGSTLDAEELRRFLTGRIAPFKIPSRIAVSDERLPRESLGQDAQARTAGHLLCLRRVGRRRPRPRRLRSAPGRSRSGCTRTTSCPPTPSSASSAHRPPSPSTTASPAS